MPPLRVLAVADTSQTDDYVVEYFTISEITSSGFSEWKEVLCRSKLTKEIVRQIQLELQKLGFYQGRIDGNFSPLTESALINFQKENYLPMGQLDKESLEVLDIDIWW